MQDFSLESLRKKQKQKQIESTEVTPYSFHLSMNRISDQTARPVRLAKDKIPSAGKHCLQASL